MNHSPLLLHLYPYP